MKLRTRLLCYTAATLLTTGAAFAAIDGNALADDYLSQGYTFVDVKVGPTQTKVEAIKGDLKVEVIYDNATQEIVTQDQSAAEADYAGRTGKEVVTVDRDFNGDTRSEDGDHKDDGDGQKDDQGDDGDKGDRGDKGDDGDRGGSGEGSGDGGGKGDGGGEGDGGGKGGGDGND